MPQPNAQRRRHARACKYGYIWCNRGLRGASHLNLFNNRMGAEESFHLTRVLGIFCLLSSLDLGHQFMYAPGAAEIAKALPKCVLLESLSLNNNFIGPCPVLSSLHPAVNHALWSSSSLPLNPRAPQRVCSCGGFLRHALPLILYACLPSSKGS